MKESDQDVADLLRGEAALLDASKKGNLARVQKLLTPENINCRDSQVHIYLVAVGVHKVTIYLAENGIFKQIIDLVIYICYRKAFIINIPFSIK